MRQLGGTGAYDGGLAASTTANGSDEPGYFWQIGPTVQGRRLVAQQGAQLVVSSALGAVESCRSGKVAKPKCRQLERQQGRASAIGILAFAIHFGTLAPCHLEDGPTAQPAEAVPSSLVDRPAVVGATLGSGKLEGSETSRRPVAKWHNERPTAKGQEGDAHSRIDGVPFKKEGGGVALHCHNLRLNGQAKCFDARPCRGISRTLRLRRREEQSGNGASRASS
uniref:Uncharacterized protein n=1 Tax=Trichuris muris TaxID=70415 RepID=A0A5S6QDN1_TRIMR